MIIKPHPTQPVLTGGEQFRLHFGCMFRHGAKALAAVLPEFTPRLTMLIIYAALTLAACVVFSGCSWIHHNAPGAPAQQVGVTADGARGTERLRLIERDSQTVATVHAWQERLDNLSIEALRAEFALMLARYREVHPVKQHEDAAKARIALWADGRVDEARASNASELAVATVFANNLATERTARAAAEQREATSRADSEKEISRLRKENQDLQDSVWRRVRFWFSLGLYTAAAVCLLLAGLRIKAAISTGLDIVAAAEAAVTWIGFSAALFVLSRVLAEPWFWWACGAVLTAAVAYVCFLVWTAQKGQHALATLKPIVATLDSVYDAKPGAEKDHMDAAIFDKLSDAMKDVPGAKALVHQIRASLQPTV